MTKSELISILADKNPHLYVKDLENTVNTVLEKIVESLEEGKRVELRGFGSFSVKKRNSRIGRNPRTGESVEVPVKYSPYFKTGKALHERLNPDLIKGED